VELRRGAASTLSLRITQGAAPLRRLGLGSLSAEAASLSLNGKPLRFKHEGQGLVLSRRVSLAEGCLLVCNFSQPRSVEHNARAAETMVPAIEARPGNVIRISTHRELH
jgi:hypothetical protein